MEPSTDTALQSLPAAEARDERLIAAMCMNARTRNEDISKKRDGLRREIQKIQDSAYVLEARYWTEYHTRIAKVAESCPHLPTSAWMSAFAHNEQQCARAVMSKQAKLREEARVKQEELEAVNKEFWDTWRQHLYSMMEFKSEFPGWNPPPTLPATHSSGHLHQNGSKKHSFNAQREVIFGPHKKIMLGKPTAAAEEAPLPEDSISRNKSPYSSAINLSQTSEQLANAAAVPEPKTPSAAVVVPAEPSPLSFPKLTTTPHDDAFVGVTNPVVGEIYQGYYKDENYHGWWMCTPLPWTSWERKIGINFSLDKANLFRDKPDCYTTVSVRATPRGRKTRTIISGWSKGFGPGGARATERVFPVLFFDDREGEPGNFQFPASPEKSFTFNKQALLALPTEWVAAKDLRPVGFDVGSPVNGRKTAEKFMERVRARRELHAKRKLGTTPRKKWAGADGCPLKDTSLVDTSAVDGEDAPGEDGPREDVPMEGSHREDVDMADAESLSGATAVDEMDASEAIKAIEAAKILMSARNSQHNSPKGTP